MKGARQAWPRRPSYTQIVNRPGDYVPDDYIQAQDFGTKPRPYYYKPKPKEEWVGRGPCDVCGQFMPTAGNRAQHMKRRHPNVV